MRLINTDDIPWDMEGVGFIPVVTKEEIDNMPTVKAEPVKHGTWKKVVPSRWGSLFECSECGEKTTETVMGKIRYEYCPMCGAKMDGEGK